MSKFHSMDDLPATLNVSDIAGYLGISIAGAYNLVNASDFPKIHVGRRIIVPKEHFIRWIESHFKAQEV